MIKEIPVKPRDLYDRLEKEFGENGVIGTHLIPVLQQESKNQSIVEHKFKGFRYLADAFFGFYLESIKEADKWCQANSRRLSFKHYPSILLKFIVHFWSFRSADILYRSGYPLDGYALLRDLKDQVITLAAIQSGLSDYVALEGLLPNMPAPTSSEGLEEMRKRRIVEENRIMRAYFGRDSGLPSEVRTQLGIWSGFFHLEVHGSRLTFYSVGSDWLAGKSALPLVPLPQDDNLTMYVNRAQEIQWMFVRLLPFLQPVENAFGPEWARRWTILEDTHRRYVEVLYKTGKPIFPALVKFINAKFPNSPNIFYRE